MAMILITDNPQGGACRCEGQAQALDLSNLSPEQVEALKQALGISETAGAGQALDIYALLRAEIDPSVAFVLRQDYSAIFGTDTPGEDVKTLANALSNINSSITRLYAESHSNGREYIKMASNIEGLRHEINVLRSVIDEQNRDLDSVRRLASTLASDLLAKGDILDAHKYMMEYGLG